MLCDILPCYGASTIDLLSTIEKQLASVGCRTPLQAIRGRADTALGDDRDDIELYLYCGDGGPDEAAYKRMTAYDAARVRNDL